MASQWNVTMWDTILVSCCDNMWIFHVLGQAIACSLTTSTCQVTVSTWLQLCREGVALSMLSCMQQLRYQLRTWGSFWHHLRTMVWATLQHHNVRRLYSAARTNMAGCYIVAPISIPLYWLSQSKEDEIDPQLKDYLTMEHIR